MVIDKLLPIFCYVQDTLWAIHKIIRLSLVILCMIKLHVFKNFSGNTRITVIYLHLQRSYGGKVV